ncbi:MAG: helix-turn-helix domain-containing protein [Alphaproteobacteria bacterium]|nr:helix-turn-helix domain-containing protein [Alphaproteobacteria bacterium]
MPKSNDRETQPPSPRPDGAPAVTRAVAILRLLGDSNEPLGVNAIARALGLVPSSCLHILRALVAESLVAVDPAKKLYSLDAGLLSLASRVLHQDNFSQHVGPDLDRIAAQFGTTCVAVRIIGLRHQVVLALSRADVLFQLQVDVGSRFPGLITASGYCCAAFGGYPEAELRTEFERLDWDEPPTFESWMESVAATRQTGYGIDEGQYIRGVSLVAAPVFRSGERISHALVAVGLGAQLDADRIAQLGTALVTAASALSLSPSGEAVLP